MAQQELIGKVLDGKYEIVKLIGEGGMGTVYEARHLLIKRRLAVKFLHSQYVSSDEVITRFQREAQAAAAIGHENIIEVTDMGLSPKGAPYIVMEYLDGVDVRCLLDNEGALGPVRAAGIMVQALSALDAAHRAGIIHRDLKPENIFLTERSGRKDYVKLLDFGISKFRSLETEGAKGLTQTGTVLGTPYYMSPEQARGDQDLSSVSDIYSMGVILYQMVTGRLPFDAPNYNALLVKILTEDPEKPEDLAPGLPQEIADTINKAMDREPENRFATCIEFRDRLSPFATGGDVDASLDTLQMSPASQKAVGAAMSDTQTPLETAESRAVERPKKRPIAVAIVSVAAIAVAAAAVWVAKRGEEQKERAAVVAPASPEQPARAPVPIEQNAGQDDKAIQELKDETIVVKIEAAPENAEITVDGAKVRSNPFEGSFKKDDVMHRIEVKADGYEATAEVVMFDQNRSLAYDLQKDEPGPDEAVEDTSTSGSKKKKRKPRTKKTSGDVEKAAIDTKSAGAPKRKKPKRKIDDDDPWE